MKETNDDFKRVRRHWRWSAGALFVWLFVYRAGIDHPLQNIVINTVMFILVLPAFLDILAYGAFLRREYKLVNLLTACSVPIQEIMDLIPSNPFASALADTLKLRSLTLLRLEKGNEAERTLRRTLSICERESNLNEARVPQILMLISDALRQQGKFEESEVFSKKAIAILESCPDLGPLQIANALADLGATLSKQGQIEEALKAGKRALEIRQNYNSSEDHELMMLGLTMNNLAVSYSDAGNYEKAQALYKQALDIKLKIRGSNSREAVVGYNNLGYALLEQSKYDQAAELLEKSRAIAIQLDLSNTVIWQSILCNCGDAHRGQGRLKEAEIEQLEVLRLREKQKAESLHHSYHCLGTLYRDKGELDKAKSYFDKALRIREQRFGKDHPKVAKTLEECAELLYKMNRAAEADKMKERAQVIGERSKIISTV